MFMPLFLFSLIARSNEGHVKSSGKTVDVFRLELLIERYPAGSSNQLLFKQLETFRLFNTEA
ncbi:hypothetical protein CHCC20347_2715 [Bacillus paralicheniformis]|nr:hypothetical protein CHCC20347_2715 [Bacillus paralicheniformis]